MSGPFHDDLRRNTARKSKADESAAACVGADQVVLRLYFLHSLPSSDNNPGNRGIQSAKLAKDFQVFVHALVADDGQSQAIGELLVLVLFKDSF